MIPLRMLDTVIDVPESVFEHDYYKEAHAVASVLEKSKGSDQAGVIGTTNDERCALYGWSDPVGKHRDSVPELEKGWMYACILSTDGLTGVWCTDTGGVTFVVRPSVGQIFELNDSNWHWTTGNGITVAAFVGTFIQPCPDLAVKLLERGVRKLAAGVYNAPRVGKGFRVMDVNLECYATSNFHTYHMVSNKAAKRFDLFVLTCCECDKPATDIDNHFPYFQEHYCRCCKPGKLAS